MELFDQTDIDKRIDAHKRTNITKIPSGQLIFFYSSVFLIIPCVIFFTLCKNLLPPAYEVRGKVLFRQVSVCSHFGEGERGVPHPANGGGGTHPNPGGGWVPHPADWGEVPHPRLGVPHPTNQGDTPSQVSRWGVPHLRSRQGVPHPGNGGYPILGPGGGTPSS